MESLTMKLLKGVGEFYWVFIGLSVASFAVESYMSVGSTKNECKKLLLKILELATDVKVYSDQMPDERERRERLSNAVGTIVEGAVICCDYLFNDNSLRFWSATTAATQIEKIKQQLRVLREYLKLLEFQPQWDKDVFLCHTDKQKNFVRQLHRDLIRNDVSCFFDEDDNSLPLAQKFPRFIFKAAETCKIAVVVISKEFIFKRWPMIELSAFIRAKNSGKNVNLQILPIFFTITPKELSDLTKDDPEWKKFAESNGTPGEWQTALREVRPIHGLSFRKDENEVAFRDQVMKKICGLLERSNPQPPHLLDFKPVGIEEQVREVRALLDMEGAASALAVIIYGYGGIGKSTLAASVVGSLDWSSSQFKFCRVAIDDKTSDKASHIVKKSHIVRLQKNILYDLGGVKPNLRDTIDGRFKIREALKKKSCLLFIDKVVHKSYIQEILPKDLLSDDQKTKLRIIITSPNKDVTEELDIICKEYEMQGLSNAASKSLLLKTILRRQAKADIDLDEKGMINEVAAACRGVPLLLYTIGKHLRVARSKDSYREALDFLREGNLQSVRDEDLRTILMHGYDKIKDSHTATRNLGENEIAQLKRCCNKSNIIGEGSFGKVYKGNLRGGDVAIKKIKHKSKDSRAFVENEVRLLQGNHHKNLVRLIAWCIEKQVFYLVYKYVNGRTLEDYMSENHLWACLGWKQRLKIIQGIAEGIQFLHSNQIIHVDIKPQNIKLSITEEEVEVKIIDFGSSRHVNWEGTHRSTNRVVGTRGYWAPEYGSNHKLSFKHDVYSFGIVVLELITGQKHFDEARGSTQFHIPQYVKYMMDNNRFQEAVEERIKHGGWDVKSAMVVAELALKCAEFTKEGRPDMDSVVSSLNSVAIGNSGEEA